MKQGKVTWKKIPDRIKQKKASDPILIGQSDREEPCVNPSNRIFFAK